MTGAPKATEQGTVAAYDIDSGVGAVLTDAGVRVEFDRAAVEASGLRLVRPGQRVHMSLDAAGGRATALTAVTLPLPSEQR